jgi:hypothetical protein
MGRTFIKTSSLHPEVNTRCFTICMAGQSTFGGTGYIFAPAGVRGNLVTVGCRTNTGGANVAIDINGTTVTGLSAIAATTSGVVGTATALNTFEAGDVVRVQLSDSTIVGDLYLTVTFRQLQSSSGGEDGSEAQGCEYVTESGVGSGGDGGDGKVAM